MGGLLIPARSDSTLNPSVRNGRHATREAIIETAGDADSMADMENDSRLRRWGQYWVIIVAYLWVLVLIYIPKAAFEEFHYDRTLAFQAWMRWWFQSISYAVTAAIPGAAMILLSLRRDESGPKSG